MVGKGELLRKIRACFVVYCSLLSHEALNFIKIVANCNTFVVFTDTGKEKAAIINTKIGYNARSCSL